MEVNMFHYYSNNFIVPAAEEKILKQLYKELRVFWYL